MNHKKKFTKCIRQLLQLLAKCDSKDVGTVCEALQICSMTEFVIGFGGVILIAANERIFQSPVMFGHVGLAD